MDNEVNQLAQSLGSALHTGQSSASSSIRPARRFSDFGRTSLTLPPVVPSKDGSRWLPGPQEETRTRGSTVSTIWKLDRSQPQPVPQHECDRDMCSMATVFETTELLEIILTFLAARDVVQLQRTCRKWESLIRQSPQLRPNLFIFPQWHRNPSLFHLLNFKVPGLEFDLGEPVDLGRWIQISMSADAARSVGGSTSRSLCSGSKLERLRSGLGTRSHLDLLSSAKIPASRVDRHWRYEHFMVVQPPILGMQAFISCDEGGDGDAGDALPSACAKLACDAGITLDFLADTTLSLLASENNASRTVIYKAIISFCAPAVALRKRNPVRTVTRIG